MQKIAITITLLFVYAGLFAQSSTGSIKAIVKDSANSLMSFSSVSLMSVSDSNIVNGKMTDENGIVFFDNLPVGNYSLTASFMGYERIVLSDVEVKADETTTLGNIIMRKNTLKLDEVVISSKIGVTEIEPQKIKYAIEDLPSQRGGTAGDILKNMPSVAMGGGPNHNRDIRYRGLGNGYTTVLINGKQSGISGNNREVVLDMIPANQIDYIEIISNPTADQTANGINGIVNIVLKKNTTKGTTGEVTFFADSQDGYNGSALVNHNTKNVTFSASYEKLKRAADKIDEGTKTKIKDDGSIKEIEDFVKTETRTFDNSAATARIEYKTKNRLNITGEYLYGEQVEDKIKDELNLTCDADDTFKKGKNRIESEIKNLNFHNPSLSIGKSWGETTVNVSLHSNISQEEKNKLRKDYEADKDGIRLETNLPKQEKEFNITEFKNLYPAFDLKSSFNNGKTIIKTGYQGFIIDRIEDKALTKLDNNTNEWKEDAKNTNIFELTENTHAAYVTSDWYIKKIKLTLGYRHEFTDLDSKSISDTINENGGNYNIGLPNSSITYNLTEKSYFKTSVGRRIRRPAYKDMNPFIENKDIDKIKVGNPDLKPETAWAYELGYFSEIKKINFGVNVFHRQISDLIQKSVITNSDGLTTESFVNLDKATSTGTEFFVGLKPFKWYDLNVNYTKFWSEIDAEGNFDGDAIKDQTDWTFKAIQNFKLPKDLTFQTTVSIVGPKETNQLSEEPIWFADLGIEKKIKENGYFSLRVVDVFDSLEKRKLEDKGLEIEEKIEDTPGQIISAGIKWIF